MTPCMMALGGRDAPHVVAMWSPCGPHVVPMWSQVASATAQIAPPSCEECMR